MSASTRLLPLIACLFHCLCEPVDGQPITAALANDTLLVVSTSNQQTVAQVRVDSTAAMPDSTFPTPAGPQTQSDTLARPTRRLRTGLLLSSSVLTLGATYVYLEKRWWGDGYTSMHLDDGRDFRYASNVDKLGHLLGGIFTADVYYGGFRWAGMAQRQAEWWAVGATAFVQLSIEFKDGFSPNYGFAWADVTVGTLGGFWPMLQHRSPFFNDSQLKISYWQRTDKYFNHRGIKPLAFSIDDYINQTYWFSFSPRYVFGPTVKQKWPDWLQFSVGFGLDANTWSPTRNGEGGLWEVYISPDIDLIKLFKPRRPFVRSVLHVLNYIKVPLPALQIAPKPKLWGLYF